MSKTNGITCDVCGAGQREGYAAEPNVKVYAEYDDDGNLVAEPAYCRRCDSNR